MSRLAQLEKLHATDPADADLMYMLAQEHAKLREFIIAVEWYDRCLARDPEYHYAYYHKARAQQAADDIAGALASIRAGKVRALRAGNAKAANELGAFLDELEP